eukprot:m.194324 g.194324  ORF g.194324 m.194324 type:complete len:138 (-) comp15449_c1_seq4:57-470(-)
MALRLLASRRFFSSMIHEGTADTIVVRPRRELRVKETTDQLRSRLLFQSRKRGIRENDLIFSTFSGKYLESLTEKQLKEYDTILNDHDNEWDMFYCLTKKKPVPEYLQNNTVLPLLLEHVANRKKEVRIDAPRLDRD